MDTHTTALVRQPDRAHHGAVCLAAAVRLAGIHAHHRHVLTEPDSLPGWLFHCAHRFLSEVTR